MTDKKSSQLNSVSYISLALALIILIDGWYAFQRYQTFKETQLTSIRNEVELISDHISAQIVTLKSQTRMFVDMYEDRVTLVAANPGNVSFLQALKYQLHNMLPDVVGFNVTDEQCNSFLEVFSEQPDEACTSEGSEKLLGQDEARPVQIYPEPFGPHLKIIDHWVDDGANSELKKGLLIVSYSPDVLARILSKKVNRDNQLYLLKNNVDGLIEVFEMGLGDDQLSSQKLSESEKQRIGYSKQIPGTSWVLAELYPENLLTGKQRTIILELLLSTLAILVMLTLLIFQIRRNSERAAKAELFLSNILESLPGVVFRAVLPVEGKLRYTFISSGAEEMLGYTVEDLKINPGVLFRATHAHDFARLNEHLQASALQLSPLRIEYRIIKKGGDYLWVREIARPHKNENGEVIWNGIILDISDLKQTEQKLLVQYSALDAANDSVLITDQKGQIEWINMALTDLTGFSADDLDGQFITRLLDVTSESGKEVEDAIVSKQKWHGELIYVRNDGVLFSADTSLTPIFSETGAIKNFIAIIRDLSEKKSMQTQLLAAQKMESIGELAAGIAHEINTPVQFVSDNVYFLKDVVNDCLVLLQQLQALEQELSKEETTAAKALPVISELIRKIDYGFVSEEAPAAITQSLQGLNRITRIVGAMKDFSHPGSSGMESINLNNIIETTIIISRNEWKYVAELTTELAPDLPSITADSQLIGQSILNFIVNASHAIAEKLQGSEEKGLITISTKSIGDRVEMRITDNGAGIPDEVKERIFEPFFTTKEVGKGSGQGLAIAYSGIVEKHRGTINVESTLGLGTTFIIAFPVKPDHAEEES